MVLKMSKNKQLIITKTGNTYYGENNAETIRVILPRKINDIDVQDCYVYLHFLYGDNSGDKIDISSNLDVYNNDYYVAQIPVTDSITKNHGSVKMWITIYCVLQIDAGKNEEDMVAKTNVVDYTIKPHMNVSDSLNGGVIYF